MKANFDRNDLDHDGYIDRSEMEQLAQRRSILLVVAEFFVPVLNHADPRLSGLFGRFG